MSYEALLLLSSPLERESVVGGFSDAIRSSLCLYSSKASGSHEFSTFALRVKKQMRNNHARVAWDSRSNSNPCSLDLNANRSKASYSECK